MVDRFITEDERFLVVYAGYHWKDSYLADYFTPRFTPKRDSATYIYSHSTWVSIDLFNGYHEAFDKKMAKMAYNQIRPRRGKRNITNGRESEKTR